MPWPWNGTIACAASPSSTARSSRCQRSRYSVPACRSGCAQVALEIRDQRQRVGEVALEQCARVGAGAHGGEARVAFVGQEQRDGEGALGVGQRDAHVAAARPDVQRVGLDAEAAVGAPAGSPVPCSRGRATRSARRGRFAGHRRRAAPNRRRRRRPATSKRASCVLPSRSSMKRGAARVEIDCVEARDRSAARAGALGGVEQGDVELAAVHRPDHLAESSRP